MAFPWETRSVLLRVLAAILVCGSATQIRAQEVTGSGQAPAGTPTEQTPETGATALPPLEVVSKAKPAKKKVAKKASIPEQTYEPVESQASAAPAERSGNSWAAATGPVEGYVATSTATATKTATPIIETPQSISVVTADQMETLKAQSLADALAYTPGIVMAPGYANSYDVFFSRGFRIQDGTGNIYRDGLRLGGSGWATGQQEVYGLERVELLKGAASVLFGAAAPGGVLNTVTKRPQQEAFREVKVEGGNYDHFSIAGDINQPISPDLAFRLVGVLRDSDTWVDYVPNDAWYLAPSLAWTPSDRTSLTVMAHVQERHTSYMFPLPVQGTLLSSPYGKIARERFVGEPSWDKQETEQWSVSALLSHEFTDHVTLRHGTRYLDSTNDVPFIGAYSWDATNPSARDRRAYDNIVSTEGVSTDTSLEWKVATGAVRHTLLAGTDYSHYTTHDHWWRGEVADLDLFDPVYGSAVGPVTYLGDSGGTISRIGVYAQDQLKYDRLTLLFSGRQDWASDTPVGGDERDYRATTGRAGAVYRFDNGFAPFVSVSQSFEPVSGFDGDGKRFEPSRGEQVEGGLRWQNPSETFLASVAVYDLTQTNVVSTDPATNKRYQTGEVRSRGFEFEAKGKVAPNWTIITGYAFTDAIITKSLNTAEIGEELRDVPRHQAMLWVERANLGLDGLTVGAGIQFVGDTKDWKGTWAEVPAFATFDAMIAYEQDFWRLALNGSNLFDEEALRCSGGYCRYGDGRRATVTLSRKW